MLILDNKQTVLPDVSILPVKQCRQFSQVTFDSNLILLFETAFAMFAKYATEVPIIIKDNFNIFYTSNRALPIIMDENEIGAAFSCVIYNVKRMLEHCGTNKMCCIIVILEELCHCLYAISNEYIVKYRVTDIVRLNNPRIQPNDLYPSVFDRRGFPLIQAYPADYPEAEEYCIEERQ